MAREAVAEIRIRKLIQWVHCENPEMIAVTVVLIAGAVVELKKMAHSILSRFRSSSHLHKRKRESLFKTCGSPAEMFVYL